eukprot:scaffold3366_cov129-Skeletonema_dohrnii-CCMP3373.AAC.7
MIFRPARKENTMSQSISEENLLELHRTINRLELTDFCRFDSLSEKGLRDIIERHELTPNNVSNYYFFGIACGNKRVNKGIIRCLLEYFPAAATAIENGSSPLHCACMNKNMTLGVVQLLVDAAPDSVRSADEDGSMPLHCLCMNKELDETRAIKILKLLLKKYPESVRHVHNAGFLPIHRASGGRSPEFCQMLIEAYPGSERMTDGNGLLPLHWACADNTLATVEYFYKLYPDAINHAATNGAYPIHYAVSGMHTMGIVEYLLDCDPNVKLQKLRRMSLLRVACVLESEDSNIHAGIEVIKAIYDAHPEGIEDNIIASNIHRYHQQVRAFINSQLVYSRQAKNHGQMTAPDSSGQLPLHTALQNNVRLGSIKLLVKGNPPALQTPDNSGALPLHVACQHHDSVNVVQYLIELDATTLDAVDRDGNTALHLACHCARHEIIAMLLEKYDAVSVSKRNTLKKLPIDLLWESDEVLDRENIEYTESIFRLLMAHPETLMNVNMKQQGTSGR